MTKHFEALGITPALSEGLRKEGIGTPTPIQEAVIPVALQNRDIIGEAPTGSGKTLAYVLPVFMKVDPARKDVQVIVMAPTHELVMQIHRQIEQLARNSGVPLRSAVIMGGVNVKRQQERLKEKPHVLVGSPGRLLELIRLRKINAQTVKTLIVDEGDRLLDDDNRETVTAVIRTTQRDRQLLVFSATMGEQSTRTAAELMKEPAVLSCEGMAGGGNVAHHYVLSEQRDKIETLRSLLAAVKPRRALVFLNRGDLIRIAASKLGHHHIPVGAIYGEAGKEERKRAMEDFAQGRTTVLIASDLAARGLDIANLTHIINMDLPETEEGYLHRAGRTGRAGASGTVLSIVTAAEEQVLARFSKSLSIACQKRELHYGKLTVGRAQQRGATSRGKAPTPSKTARKTPSERKRPGRS